MTQVILVDQTDQPMGFMEKQEAHEKGLLHRAFSVFIFNDQNQLLLQQRAFHKYHSGGLWTNTCCSHPAPQEITENACHRRLMEEMGFDTSLEFVTSFTYKADLDQGLTEHEFDHVYIGRFNDTPNPNRDEVAGWKYIDLDELECDMENHPESYTVWFKIIYQQVKSHLLSSAGK